MLRRDHRSDRALRGSCVVKWSPKTTCYHDYFQEFYSWWDKFSPLLWKFFLKPKSKKGSPQKSYPYAFLELGWAPGGIEALSIWRADWGPPNHTPSHPITRINRRGKAQNKSAEFCFPTPHRHTEHSIAFECQLGHKGSSTFKTQKSNCLKFVPKYTPVQLLSPTEAT